RQRRRDDAHVPVPGLIATRLTPADNLVDEVVHAREKMMRWMRGIRERHIGLVRAERRPIGLTLGNRFAGTGKTGPVVDHRIGKLPLLARFGNLRPQRRCAIEVTEDERQFAGVEASELPFVFGNFDGTPPLWPKV